MKKLFFVAALAIVAVGGALTVNGQASGYVAPGQFISCTQPEGNSCEDIQLYTNDGTPPTGEIPKSTYEDYSYVL